MTGLSGKFRSNFRHMLALKARGREFVFARHAGSVAAGNGAGTVRGTTGNLINSHLTLERIGQSDYHKTLVQQRDMKAENRGFLPAMLGGGACKNAADFADQRTVGPELPCGARLMVQRSVFIQVNAF